MEEAKVLRDLRVLLIEDEPDSAEIIHHMLLHYDDLEIHHVTSAEDAYSRLSGAVYSLLVVDLALPGIDGFELMRQLRQHSEYAHLPTIAVTAYPSAEHKRLSMTVGFDRFLPKPLDPEVFEASLRDLIG